MKRKKLLGRALVTSLCVAALASCFNDVDLKNINTDASLPNALAFPLGNVRMELKDIIGKMDIDSMLSMNEGESDINVIIADSVLYEFDKISLSHEMSPFTVGYSFEDYFEEHPLLEYLPGVPIPGGQTLPSAFTYDVFDMALSQDASELITRARINELAFQANVFQNIEGMEYEDIKIKVEFDGNVVSYYDGRQGTVADSVVSQGANIPAMFVFRNIEIRPGTGEDSKLPITMTIELYTGEDGIILERTNEVSVEFSVATLDWEVAFGDFQPTVLGESKNRHNFDLSFLSGFKFYNPQINIDIRTNVGSQFVFNVDYIKAYREAAGGGTEYEEYAEFDGGEHSAEFILRNRSEAPGTWGEMNSYAFDREYGKTNLLFANDSTPNVLEYSYSVGTSEKEADEAERFITPDAGIEVKAKAVIPLYFAANNEEKIISISDTIRSLKLDSILPEGVKLERAFLALNIENGLPVAVVFSLDKFLDKDGNKVEVPLGNTSCNLPMPVVNEEGLFVAGSNVQKIPFNIDIDEEAYAQLRKVNKICYSVNIKQEAEKKVRFVQHNFFGLEVGVFVKGEINSSAFEISKNN